MKQKPGEFKKRVWELARQIPAGRVSTYGVLTAMAGGHPMLSRMITTILSSAPDAATIPFHRIVYSNGKVWLDPKHEKERRKLYKKEGIRLDKNNRIIDFEKIIYLFPND